MLRLGLWLVLSSLAACTPPPKPDQPEVLDPLAAEAGRAQALLDAGQLRAAAEAFEGLARTAPTERATGFRLSAVAALLELKELRAARALLDTVAIRGLSPADGLNRMLLAAGIALAERDPAAALKLLPERADERLPGVQHVALHELRANCYAQLGNYIEAARERVLMEIHLLDEAGQEYNRRRLWKDLGNLEGPALLALKAPPPDTLGGWMELAAIAKAYGLEPEILQTNLVRWQEQYPGHPATGNILRDLLESTKVVLEQPVHIALLLPLEGKFAEAAGAIRDGFIAAWYEQTTSAEAPIVSIRHADAANIWSAFHEVSELGADFVVGPLDKESVTLLARSDSLPLPTLALNRADAGERIADTSLAPDGADLTDTAPSESAEAGADAKVDATGDTNGNSDAEILVATEAESDLAGTEAVTGFTDNLYQFALAPEGEARQLAERVWLDGHSRMALVGPDNAWGRRVLSAFRQRWESMGGLVVSEELYAASANDMSQPIKKMLQIDASERRARALRDRLGLKLEFEPRRRQDIDAVFMAAFPRQGRQLRPQLQFHHASGLPVYATSHVYSGEPAPRQDRDLNGVVFGDMPWRLGNDQDLVARKQQMQTALPNIGSRYDRLVAFGYDAYRLVTRLRRLQANPITSLRGATGRLTMGPGNQVQRELSWARFKHGQARALTARATTP